MSWNHAHVLRFKDRELQTYVEYYLKHIDLSPYISGSAQPKLNQQMLNTIPIPVPSSEKIEKSVAVLDRIVSIKKRREKELEELDNLIKARFAPRFVIYATNDSMRTVIITKIVFSIDTNVFYVDIRDGLQELRIQPSGVDRITFNGSSVVQSYHKAGMEKLCNPADKIDITIHDNYKRKYKIRTDLTIGMFESDL